MEQPLGLASPHRCVVKPGRQKLTARDHAMLATGNPRDLFVR